MRLQWPKWLVLAGILLGALPAALALPHEVRFSPPPASVEAFDFVEFSATVDQPDVTNPFTHPYLTGSFQSKDHKESWSVEGFSDSQEGSLFRVRFMPPAAGEYSYSVHYQQGTYQKTASGSFRAIDAHRHGLIKV